MTTILFTGGRDYTNDKQVYRTIRLINPSKVVVGDAEGADRLVRTFCKRLEIPFEVFKADWEKHGRGAGPIRNKEMINVLEKSPGMVVAFPGGRGTDNCIKQAKEAGFLVLKTDDQ